MARQERQEISNLASSVMNQQIKSAASHPGISGNHVSHTKSELATCAYEIEVGQQSALIIMMASPLLDREIADSAAYLKDAKYEN